MLKRGIFIVAFLLAMVCNVAAENGFVSVVDGQFFRNDAPYYYIGANYWYGPLLGAKGKHGDRKRLTAELDQLKALGINNLRVAVGIDATADSVRDALPCLQSKPGRLNTEALEGLDYFLAELDKRDMVAVVCLNNALSQDGGCAFYLSNAGVGEPPASSAAPGAAYAARAAQFLHKSEALQMFYDFVKQIVARKNSVTGKFYKDDPAIMAWEVDNNPQCFSPADKKPLADYLHAAAQLIHKLDANHLVAAGSAGAAGCAGDLSLYEQIHLSKDFDYLTVHLEPVEWKWANKQRLFEDLQNVYPSSKGYIDDHLRLAEKLSKPLVIEYFAYPRDMYALSEGSSTQCRDAFFSYIANMVSVSSRRDGCLGGCNFQGWSGTGRPQHEMWQKGDTLLCDPLTAPQGGYSVYDTDSTTLETLKSCIEKIK
jgi:mannan endo-1,4-beta-mannosidase